jgi:hypothetical protein
LSFIIRIYHDARFSECQNFVELKKIQVDNSGIS